MIPFNRPQTDYPQTSGNLSVRPSDRLSDRWRRFPEDVYKGEQQSRGDAPNRQQRTWTHIFSHEASLQSSNGSKLTPAGRRVTSRSRSNHYSLISEGSGGQIDEIPPQKKQGGKNHFGQTGGSVVWLRFVCWGGPVLWVCAPLMTAYPATALTGMCPSSPKQQIPRLQYISLTEQFMGHHY